MTQGADVDDAKRQVARGGSFVFGAGPLRAAFRYFSLAEDCTRNLGFRVAARPGSLGR